MKKLSVVVAGTGQIRDVEIQPGTTAGDILHQLTLPDYLLSKGPNEPFFAAAESIYDKVKDGEKIFASTKAEVGVHGMRIKDLGIQACPRVASRADFASDAGASPHNSSRAPPDSVLAGARLDPTRSNTYSGNYQTPYGAFQGWIEQERSGRINFYLYNPSAEIRSHSHWTCFQHRGNDWYLIHMGREPKDVSSGIMTIERLIKEAYE